MTIINGVDMPNFNHREIPEHIAKFMSLTALARIQTYRDIINCPFDISMTPGALIRFDGSETSQHHVVKLKQSILKVSTAIDGFPLCNIFKAWTLAISSRLFSGVGVYFDTKNNQGVPQPMLHLDLRTEPLIWFRDKGQYFYPSHKYFYEILNELLEKEL